MTRGGGQRGGKGIGIGRPEHARAADGARESVVKVPARQTVRTGRPARGVRGLWRKTPEDGPLSTSVQWFRAAEPETCALTARTLRYRCFGGSAAALPPISDNAPETPSIGGSTARCIGLYSGNVKHCLYTNAAGNRTMVREDRSAWAEHSA